MTEVVMMVSTNQGKNAICTLSKRFKVGIQKTINKVEVMAHSELGQFSDVAFTAHLSDSNSPSRSI